MTLTPIAIKEGGRRFQTASSGPAPLVTILIVVFRDRDELATILESILPLRTPNIEVVVIDGGSQDGTVELLEESPSVDYWLSEKDRGIYDAMNKGLEAARGTYVLHLNAGDRLRHVPWKILEECAVKKIDVLCCKVLIDGKDEFVSRTGLLSKLDNTWHHQGTFYRLAAHLGYDCSYPTGADFDHNQRLLKKKCTRWQCDDIVADHASDGITQRKDGHVEIYRSVYANFGWFYLQLSRLRFTARDLRDLILRR